MHAYTLNPSVTIAIAAQVHVDTGAALEPITNRIDSTMFCSGKHRAETKNIYAAET